MKLWTLCADRTKWKNNWDLRRSDSMGNVVDRLEEQEGSYLTLQEYPDGFLDSFDDVIKRYEYHIDEHEEYDNDDYDIYTSSDREYSTELRPADKIVISNGYPVGHMIESKRYGGGMDNRTWTYGTILFFDKPNREKGETFSQSCTVYDKNGRWSTTRTYTIIERK